VENHPTQAVTRLPTQTPTATSTSVPTPTETPEPVPEGFTVPKSQEPINAGSVSRISGLARWGSGAISQVAASQDGSILAIASSQGLDIYSKGGLTPLYHWASGLAVSSVTVSEQKGMVAYAIDERIIVASLETGSQITEMVNWSQTGLTSLLFSPDGNHLAEWEKTTPGSYGENTRFCITETKTWQEVNCFNVYETLMAVQISPRSGYVAAAGGFNDGVYIWKLNTGELVNKISEWYIDDLNGLFSPDDSRFVNHSGLDISLVDLSTSLPLLAIQDSPLLAYDRAFSPDGNFLVLGGEAWDVAGGMLLLWDLETDTTTKYNLSDWVTSVSFSQDGSYLASTTRDGKVQLWEFNDRRLKKRATFAHENVNNVVFGYESSTLITLSSDQIVKVWDIDSGDLQKTIGESVFTGAFTAVAISQNLEYVAAYSESGDVVVWRAENGEQVHIFRQAETGSNIEQPHLGFTHDGKYLLGLDGDHIRQWSLENGKMTQEFQLSGDKDNYLGPQFIYVDESYYFLGPEYTATFADTKDELLIVLNEWSKALLRRCIPSPAWKIQHRTILKGASDFSGRGTLPCLTSDARNILVSPDGASLYTLYGGGEKACTRDEYYVINSICGLLEPTPEATEDNKYFISSWGLADGLLKREIQLAADAFEYFSSWSISPDGKLLAVATMNGIDILDAVSGETLQQITPPKAQALYQTGSLISTLPPLFSLDATLLFTVVENEINIWEASSGQLLHTLSGHSGEVTSIAISTDGTWLVSASADGTIRLWGIR